MKVVEPSMAVMDLEALEVVVRMKEEEAEYEMEEA